MHKKRIKQKYYYVIKQSPNYSTKKYKYITTNKKNNNKKTKLKNEK